MSALFLCSGGVTCMSRMSTGQEENDIYIIPPNFIDTGTIFGGTIKLRNAVEALILALLIGVPVFHLPVTLTTKIIIACLTVLPAGLFAIIGIGGESLSSFVFNFFVYLKNRRIVGMTAELEEANQNSPQKNQNLPLKGRKRGLNPKRRILQRNSDNSKRENKQGRHLLTLRKTLLPAEKGISVKKKYPCSIPVPLIFPSVRLKTGLSIPRTTVM